MEEKRSRSQARGIPEQHPPGAAADKQTLQERICNPLSGIPRGHLMSDVEDFAARNGLQEHTAILKKGALIAQNPDKAHAIDGEEKLTPHELNVLERESTHKWHMPKRLLLTIATCSVAAAIQGWDQTGTNGATIFFRKYYDIDSAGPGDNLIIGLVNAAPYIGSAVLGCWLSDPLNNAWGRRGAIFFAAHFCIWPVIGAALCRHWRQQLACRLLIGIGMGVRASTVPVYAAENAPAAIRGALVMSWQIWTAFGILMGSAFNLMVFDAGRNINWRLMLGAPCLPAIPLVVLIFLCPESPRWYIKKRRYKEAWNSLLLLRHDPVQAARDLYLISAQLEMESQLVGKTNYLTRITQLFTVPRIRRAHLAALTTMVAQQLCGVNIIAFYSTSIFVEAKLSPRKALLGSFGFGLINWLFSFPAFWTIDSFGRRSLLLFTFPQMTWTLLAAGLCTLISPDAGSLRTGLVCLFVFLFGAFYSPGAGPVPFVYSAEVYPLSHRETGMAFAVASCLFSAALLGITFPFLLSTLETAGAFALYAGFNIVSLVLIFLWVPETKQRSLEELDHVFAVPVRTFMKYQVRVALPWWIKRYLLCQRNAEKPPLYDLDADASGVHKTPYSQYGRTRAGQEAELDQEEGGL